MYCLCEKIGNKLLSRNGFHWPRKLDGSKFSILFTISFLLQTPLIWETYLFPKYKEICGSLQEGWYPAILLKLLYQVVYHLLVRTKIENPWVRKSQPSLMWKKHRYRYLTSKCHFLGFIVIPTFPIRFQNSIPLLLGYLLFNLENIKTNII